MNQVDRAAMQAMQGQPRPAVVMATPMNDIQIVALIAAQQVNKTATEAVQWAIDVLSDAHVQMENDQYGDVVKAKRSRRQLDVS